MHECMYVLDFDESHVSPAFIHCALITLLCVFPFLFLILMLIFSIFGFIDVGFPRSLQNFVVGEAVRCFSFIRSRVCRDMACRIQGRRLCTNYRRGERIVIGNGCRK
ncbi:hypothetical protein M752DRAFT_29946 [Aspergillus phoenicis ATCC 13157]|uniref:Uncharacterized protein n=1 Tax=Aspergillus phoenicis ATCC 13157 TaxID=1353007 RepID=A0A370PFM9_ASPPH|nr:hypothetical protein M752DRAFT_29946 [Aspergillus phoenicis ATCC 13157]